MNEGCNAHTQSEKRKTILVPLLQRSEHSHTKSLTPNLVFWIAWWLQELVVLIIHRSADAIFCMVTEYLHIKETCLLWTHSEIYILIHWWQGSNSIRSQGDKETCSMIVRKKNVLIVRNSVAVVACAHAKCSSVTLLSNSKMKHLHERDVDSAVCFTFSTTFM